MELQPESRLDWTRDQGWAEVYQAGLEVTSILDLNQVLQTVVEKVSQFLCPDAVALYVYDAAQDEFTFPTVFSGGVVSPGRMPDKDGIADRIVRKRAPVLASDAAEGLADPLFDERPASLAGFPLQVGDAVVGVLLLSYRQQRELTSEDVQKIILLTGQAAIAIRNAELFRLQESVTKRLQVLQQAQKAIDSATGLEEVLKQILSEGLKIVATERGSLMLIEGDDLVTKAQFGPEISEPDRQTMTFKVGEGIAGRVAASARPFLSSDVRAEPFFKAPPLGKELRFRSLLAVPIISREEQVLGVISVDDPKVGHFDETHQQLLSDMAGQFATAIERMLLVDTLHALHTISERLTAKAIADRELSPVLNEIAKSAIEILRIGVVTIYRYDESRNRFFVPPLMKGISEKRPMQAEVFKGEAPWVLVHDLKQSHYAPDAPSDLVMNPPRPPGKGEGFVTREGIKSAAGLLLKVGEEIVGAMFVNYRSAHSFPDREKQILETFANSAAIAIQDARKWEELKRAQEELLQTARMSAMGGLAGGLAHELKNPLASILSSVNLLEMGISKPEAVSVKLQAIKLEVLRARSIIDSLLDFVRSPEAGRGPVDLLALLSEILNLLKNQAKLNHIELDTEHLRRVPQIQGHAGTLKQVFLNILTNAIEAMPDGGLIRVGTAVENDYVRIEIQDTGVGISPDVKERIFEPLFTTKAAAHGVGLGLSVSYRIVHDHQGEIRVRSEPGKGSVFIVFLPIGEESHESSDR